VVVKGIEKTRCMAGTLLPRGKPEVTRGTILAWEGVAVSVAFLLEFYDGPNVVTFRRVSGRVVPSDGTERTLSQVTVENLSAWTSYWWCVVAFGPGGGILPEPVP
jgi:hypothetical protein